MLDFEDFKREYQKVPVEEYPNNVKEAMPEPVASVHVSTYQHADFIRDCLDGVLMQETDFPFEVIIGEDESDDGTREICKEYADRYPDKIRLFLHRRENNIQIHDRPTGRFQFTYSHFVARGKYIAICEGDDYWTDPKKLQKQVDFLEENPEYVLTHHNAHVVNSHDEVVKRSKLPEQDKRDYSREELIRSPFILTLSICCENIFDEYPEEFMGVLNGDNFVISMLGKYGKAAYLKDIKPARYRMHDESMWSSRSHVFQARSHSKTAKSMNTYYRKSGYGGVSKYFENVYYECRAKEAEISCAKHIGEKEILSSIEDYVRFVKFRVLGDGVAGLKDVILKSIKFFL